MRIAIVGSGIGHGRPICSRATTSTCSRRTSGPAATRTRTGHLPDATVAVDTGFLVYNERTYPRFSRLLAQLGVATQPSDMSFGLTDQATGLEWRGTSLNTVFAQRRNVVRPGVLAMLADVARFNRLARACWPDPAAPTGTLEPKCWPGTAGRSGFMERYLVPMGSDLVGRPDDVHPHPGADLRRVLRPPRPAEPGQPAPVADGDRRVGSLRGGGPCPTPAPSPGRLHLASGVTKVRRQGGRVELLTDDGPAAFDHVVLAVHSDEALELLADPTGEERATLGAIRYQANRATLHTDTRLLPKNRRAWAAWNYLRRQGGGDLVTLTYYLNRLQGLDLERPLLVTLNRDAEIRSGSRAAPVRVRPPRHRPGGGDRPVAPASHQPRGHLLCGAYWGYGFHEDGVTSAVAVCERFGARV